MYKKMVFALFVVALFLLQANCVYSFSENDYNAISLRDVKKAYAAAQTFFSDDYLNANSVFSGTERVVTEKDIENNGYDKSWGVTIRVIDGRRNSLIITSSHVKGNVIYTIDKKGNITSQDQKHE
jgi:hypothetical protein